MILKQHEINKLDIKIHHLILFYGNNHGAKDEAIIKLTKLDTTYKLTYYEEKQVLENYETFFNEVTSKSLFEEKKVIVIKRSTDKLVKVIEEIEQKDITNTSVIINSDNLDKKSKLRAFFEKKKELICIPFYPDNISQLASITSNFFRNINYSISSSNINLIISKSNGDRGILKKELEKIELFVQNNKKLTEENLLKLINIVENYSITELIDNCLAKNKKKTINILNENNFSNDDSVMILRTLLNKSKRILYLSNEFKKNRNINLTISSAKPPIFWKDKEITKVQINKWTPEKIKNLIYNINDLELKIKKNLNNPVNLITDFILEQSA